MINRMFGGDGGREPDFESENDATSAGASPSPENPIVFPKFLVIAIPMTNAIPIPIPTGTHPLIRYRETEAAT